MPDSEWNAEIARVAGYLLDGRTDEQDGWTLALVSQLAQDTATIADSVRDGELEPGVWVEARSIALPALRRALSVLQRTPAPAGEPEATPDTAGDATLVLSSPLVCECGITTHVEVRALGRPAVPLCAPCAEDQQRQLEAEGYQMPDLGQVVRQADEAMAAILRAGGEAPPPEPPPEDGDA